MSESHVAEPDQCGEKTADLYTEFDHACAETEEHTEHVCVCGERWRSTTLDPEEG